MADKKASDAAWTLISSFHEANQAVVGHLTAAQERNRKLAENFFMEGMEVLKANQEAVEKLVTAQERNVQYTQRFFTEGMEVLKANREAAEGLVAAQDRNMQYAQRFFNDGIEALKSQVEGMRGLLNELEQQVRKQQEALQTLAYAPMEITLDVLRAPLTYYQRMLGVAGTIAQQGLEQVQKATEPAQRESQVPPA